MTDLKQIERRRLQRQREIDSLSDSDRRNRLGQFATPPALALAMAQYAQRRLAQHPTHRRAPLRFFEPALGSGAFFSAVMRAFGEEGLSRSVGVELDSQFAAAARQLWSSSSLEIVEDDFTRLDPPLEKDRFDLILANPPYVRHHHLTIDEKHRLRRRVAQQTQIDLSGLAGLYCYFMLLADAWLAEGGLAMWLAPAEWMDVNYGSALRSYLSEKVTLMRVHRFADDDPQFDDALVSSAVVVLEKRPPPTNHQTTFSLGGSLQEPRQSRQVSAQRLKNQRKWGLLAKPGRRKPRRSDFTLGDLFDIKRGLATGNNSFFILPRHRAEELGIAPCWLRPILPSPRHVQSSIIRADDLGYPRLDRPLALIDCDSPETEIQRRCPDFWDYLQSGKRAGVQRGYLASRRSPWYSQERRPPAPFLCTYMGRASSRRASSRRASSRRAVFRMLWNQSQATAANVYLMLYPKNDMQAALQAEPALSADVFSALSGIETDAIIEEGRVYGGGLHKVEPAELRRLSADTIAKAARLK